MLIGRALRGRRDQARPTSRRPCCR